MKPSCSCCPEQKQGSASSKAPRFGWNLCSSSPSVQEMGRMRVAVAWQPPACAPEPLRPRSHLCLCSALLPVGPDGQARRGQVEGNRPSVFPGQARVSVAQAGFWAAGLSGRGAGDSAMSAWVQGASLVPTSYTQHTVLPVSVLPHPELLGFT